MVIPLPLPGTFTYLVPDDLIVAAGHRVIVQFGRQKIYTGIVVQIAEAAETSGLKSIIEVLDEDPIICTWQIDFFYWLAGYYLCTPGEVVKAALPAGLKLSSEAYVSLNPDWEWEDSAISDREEALRTYLGNGEKSIEDLSRDLNIKRPQALIKSLRDKQVLHVYEKVQDKYQPKTRKMVRLTPHFKEEIILETLFAELEKKPKQLDVLLAYLREVDRDSQVGISKKQLAKACSTSSINTLLKKGILEEWETPVSRLPEVTEGPDWLPELSPIQAERLEQIKTGINKQSVVLLHGITGSGKTELYIQLIHEVIQSGGTVLYLLPEIALTTQIIHRLRKVFGYAFGVYHSHYSDNERVEVWQKVLSKDYPLVVGVRSAIFLPFDSLDLVIVDEEHDTSYKQYDPAPRYHARDAAIYLAQLHQGKVLLGSATPAIETYYKALQGKFGLVSLNERYGASKSPGIERIDFRLSKKRKEVTAEIFTKTLLDAIRKALDHQEQVILFQNRRGYAPYLICEDCNEVIECPNCDVSLTYHQYQQQLICHYCGYRQFMPNQCPTCGSPQLVHSGSGTEQLETQLQPIFPDATIQRLDLDTTRSKFSYQRILNDFEEGKTDILIGTQMISKGLDFDRVNLVGIFDIDRLLYYPDFRSHERVYQLITQVSGRAGRKSGTGIAYIQTQNPNHQVLQQVVLHDYDSFYQKEITDRETYAYPPFYRIIKIVLKHREALVARQSSELMAQYLSEALGEQVIGPVDALIPRIRNFYHREIQLKIGAGRDLPRIKDALVACRERILTLPNYKSVKVVFDVDPM